MAWGAGSEGGRSCYPVLFCDGDLGAEKVYIRDEPQRTEETATADKPWW